MSDERRRRFRFWPDGYDPLHRLSETVKTSGLEGPLLELVRMRASQVNGCAYCIDMHSKDARAAGETEQRLYALSAWRETPFFSPRERAALAFTEAVTLVADSHVPSTLLDEVEEHFTAEEMTWLLYAVIEINAWNRLGIATRTLPGSYQPS
jgi:AhpD family alkylhydroperoxidase